MTHRWKHDKVMLIGSSDGATADIGKLRVTLHHNLFANTGQRTPRARFGQDHIYNDYFVISDPERYVYSWGVGIQSQIFAENNFFQTTGDVTPAEFMQRFNGTAIHVSDTFVNGKTKRHEVDVLAAYNAVNTPDLSPNVGWTPTLFVEILGNAGPFKE